MEGGNGANDSLKSKNFVNRGLILGTSSMVRFTALISCRGYFEKGLITYINHFQKVHNLDIQLTRHGIQKHQQQTRR
jgi:hypothetical protein